MKRTQCFTVEGVHANKPSWNTIKLWGENKMIAADTWHPWVTVALLHGWGKQGCIVKCEVVSQKREVHLWLVGIMLAMKRASKKCQAGEENRDGWK
jgi:hypothetical protein